MILPKLRSDLDIMLSPATDMPGVLIRDAFRFTNAQLIVPPVLLGGVALFDGTRTEQDLQAELTGVLGEPDGAVAARHLIDGLSRAGFLEDETYARLKGARLQAFAESEVVVAAHAGSAYPAELGPLRELMQRYLTADPAPSANAVDGAADAELIGIAAPHISPEGGWQCYRAAYQTLTPDLRDRTFVVLGTSHYGQANKFGLTRKPFETPFGRTTADDELVAQLESEPAAVIEDYCHTVEHSIEFQVLFLQSIYGADVRVLPVLCGSFGKSSYEGGLPEDDEAVRRFIGTLGEVAEREKDRLFWVLGVDMAHMGVRYGDKFEAVAERNEMTSVRERDKLRIERISASDAQGFWDLVRGNGDDLKWCGSSPFYTFLKVVPGARGTLRRYEQWNIDERSVVSFAGISFAR